MESPDQVIIGTHRCIFMNKMSEFFYAHDLEVMKSKALEYESAIAEGNWAALDLAPSH